MTLEHMFEQDWEKQLPKIRKGSVGSAFKYLSYEKSIAKNFYLAATERAAGIVNERKKKEDNDYVALILESVEQKIRGE